MILSSIKTFNENKEWFYFGQGKPIDPMNWKEILEVHKNSLKYLSRKIILSPKRLK